MFGKKETKRNKQPIDEACLEALRRIQALLEEDLDRRFGNGTAQKVYQRKSV